MVGGRPHRTAALGVGLRVARQLVDVDGPNYIGTRRRGTMLRGLSRARAIEVVRAVDALEDVLIVQLSRDDILRRRLAECLTRCRGQRYMRLECRSLGHGNSLVVGEARLGEDFLALATDSR